MVDLLTTNETYFFREEAHFEFLKTIVADHPPGTPFNVWSAASSTGEEIYTISFVLADTLGLDANWRSPAPTSPPRCWPPRNAACTGSTAPAACRNPTCASTA
jgi:hypothetical protein